MGFSVAIDDLGAGYAGLRTWSELRPDFVKLDRHFIQGIHEDSAKRQFVYSIQEIAASMGCTAIAEGIEIPEELLVVKSLGVSMGQGYHFDRPSAVPRTELPALRECVRNGAGPLNVRRSKTLAALMRSVPTVARHVTVEEVGELFTGQPRLMSIPVVAEGRPLGMVRRFDFMNMYASRYGRDLYGRKSILHFMDNSPLVVEKALPVEKASQLITDQERIYRGDDFIIAEGGATPASVPWSICCARSPSCRSATPGMPTP
jgi:CBS domain-containing protein